MTSDSPVRSDRSIRVTTPEHPISLANPDAVVVAIPYLLGFRPEHSLVLLWIAEGRLALTQRVDLPEAGLSAEQQAAYLDALLSPGWDTRADSLIACVISDVPTAVRAQTGSKATGLVMADLVGSLAQRLRIRGLDLLDALSIRQSPGCSERWWSYLCHEGCCPEQGREVPESVRIAVAAAFTLEGFAVADSRADMAQSMTADPMLVEQVAMRLSRRRTPAQSVLRERWRTTRISRIRLLLGLGQTQPERQGGTSPHPRQRILTVRELVDLIHGLGDVRVRDCVLWSLSRTGDLRRVIPMLMQGLRAAPDAGVPPIASCVAVATWLTGDGARAAIALERALAVDPDYSLARLLDLALRSGMPPTRWAAMMSALREDECRGRSTEEGGLQVDSGAL